MEWLNDNKIQVVPPRKPKKITGTRLAAIFGENKWVSPFEVWCAITRTYEKPFEDTKYTLAGKAIEPKQAEYIQKQYFWQKMLTPADKYGKDYFKKTYGDFFPDNNVFGGMWDYLFVDKDGNPTTVLEMKTTKRAEDWAFDIPEYYALQAALYAHLLGVDDVIMVVSVLDDPDYDDPGKFVCSSNNTFTRLFKVSERYPDFERKYIKGAIKWWKEHVENGVSPEYDATKDAEILKVLTTNNLSPETDVAELVKEAEALKTKLDALAAEQAEDTKRYKVVTDMLKQAAIQKFRDGDKKVAITGTTFVWEVSKTQTAKVDTNALKEDGLFDKYAVLTDSYRLTPKVKED